jgi:hypothetical protein
VYFSVHFPLSSPSLGRIMSQIALIRCLTQQLKQVHVAFVNANTPDVECVDHEAGEEVS